MINALAPLLIILLIIWKRAEALGKGWKEAMRLRWNIWLSAQEALLRKHRLYLLLFLPGNTSSLIGTALALNLRDMFPVFLKGKKKLKTKGVRPSNFWSETKVSRVLLRVCGTLGQYGDLPPTLQTPSLFLLPSQDSKWSKIHRWREISR